VRSHVLKTRLTLGPESVEVLLLFILAELWKAVRVLGLVLSIDTNLR